MEPPLNAIPAETELSDSGIGNISSNAHRLFRNKMKFDMLKFALKSILNLVNNSTAASASGSTA